MKQLYNIVDYGAVAGVPELQTAKIQAAIDAAFLAGGGEVVVPAGTFKTATIRLRSNITLHLLSGAVLDGSTDPDDYTHFLEDTLEPIDPEKEVDDEYATGTFLKPWYNAIIKVYRAENVKIIGEKDSVICGNNTYNPNGEEGYRGPHAIQMTYCKNLEFGGYTVKDSANWSHTINKCNNIFAHDLTVLGGHDGFHVRVCKNVLIENCEFYTGDDCVAGFDNYNVTVRNCILNSACSGMRFGGADILVENCRFYGPAQYVFRGAMPLADKIAGKPSPRVNGGKMLALFTYYSDFSLNVRRLPKNIIIRNCIVENCARFLHFDFTGTHTWQKNKPLVEITFDTIQASGISLPFNAYGSAETPLTLRVKNCDIRFSAETDCAIRSGNFTLIDVENTRFENVTDTLVKGYGGEGEIRMEKVNGVKRLLHKVDEKFISDNI